MQTMAAQRDVILIGLWACLLLGQGANAVYTMAETCKLFAAGYIADPKDCQSWGYCSGGQLVGGGKCNEGLQYDARSGDCNYKDAVQCATSKSDMCTGLNAVFKADPDDCQQFCYCTDGTTECKRCPPDQLFNPDSNSCVWAVTLPPCAANSPCRLVPNNRFVGDPANCVGYLRCVDGVGIPGTCTPPYVFNPSNGLCDTFTTAECPNAPSDSNNGDKKADVAAICKKNFAAGGGKTQFFSDLLTCEGYVACDAPSNGNWQKCPFATHFNPAVKQCVTPYTYACPYNRCANLDLAFVTAYNSECGAYISCSNQQNVTAAQPCNAVNSEFSYFDESQGGCVQQQPKQEICSQLSPKS